MVVDPRDCHSCGVGNSLPEQEEARLIREVLATAISADASRHVFYSNSDGPRFYRVNGGKMRVPGVATVKDVDDLNTAAISTPWKDYVFVDIEVLGSSGADSVYVRATVTERAWLPDFNRFGDDIGSGTYCIERNGNRVLVTEVIPPIYTS
jgi:hypothetical protein